LPGAAAQGGAGCCAPPGPEAPPSRPDAPGSGHAGSARAGAPTPVAGPALPTVPDVPCFTGRVADVAALTDRLAGSAGEPVTLLVSGAPGVGKTALARHVAHRVRDRFPGGRLLVRMVRPDGTPRPAAEVTAEVTAALGVTPGDGERGSGPSPGGRGRALLVLDDVCGADQVRPLLPAGGDRPYAAVLVTSRRGLAGLVATHGGWVHRLGAFTPAESRALLDAVLGTARVAAEPAAARRLAEVCGHHPLALRITTAWLLTRPGLRLGDAAEWLAEDPFARLALADDPRLSVARVLRTAVDRLDPPAARAFGRLGTLPAGGFRTAEAEAVLGPPPGCAGPVLERLADAGLLEDGPPGPYRMHALLRAYARSLAPPAPHGPARGHAPGRGGRGGARTGARPKQKV
ncbi:AAA family ATPase, partial [Streptomyces sp. JJ36]|nr:AAA family ATPase [Streptomyces sp. JJ36]